MRTGFVGGCIAALVLALGIALGAGPLQHSGQQRDRELASQKRKVAAADARIDALTAAGKYASDFASANAKALVTGALSGRTVGLVLLPGADPETVTALRSLIATAGGRVTSEATLAPVLASSSSRQLVEALTSQMVTQNPGLPLTADASGYERLGALLARAVAADRRPGAAGAAYDQTSVGIVAGLEAASLVTGVKAAPRASLTLVVAGPPATSTADAAANDVPVTIVKAFAAGTPTVLAGSTASAGPRGILGDLRSDAAAAAAVSAVDSVDTPMGQVAAILALAARVQGRIGQYGAVHASGGPIPAP